MKWFFAALFLSTAAVHGEKTNIEACNTGPEGVNEALKWLGFSNLHAPQLCIPTDAGERCFYLYVPQCASENSPLVFDYHGLNSCPQWQANTTGWASKAEEKCFVVVWPLGNVDPALSDESCWALRGGIPMEDGIVTSNCCCHKDGAMLADLEPFEDYSFLHTAAGAVVQVVDVTSTGAVTIDTKRIYLAGHSNGCMASLAMAALYSDMVAAVCCHSGAMVTDFADDYQPVPVWSLHGAKDHYLPMEGWPNMTGQVHGGLRYEDGTGVFGQMDEFNLLADKNGCAAEAEVLPVRDGEEEVGRVMTRSGCTNGANVTKLILFESGHMPYLNVEEISPGASMTTIDTTAMAWDFCSTHSKATAPALPLPTTKLPLPAWALPTTHAPTRAQSAAPTSAITSPDARQYGGDDAGDTSGGTIASWALFFLAGLAVGIVVNICLRLIPVKVIPDEEARHLLECASEGLGKVAGYGGFTVGAVQGDAATVNAPYDDDGDAEREARYEVGG